MTDPRVPSSSQGAPSPTVRFSVASESAQQVRPGQDMKDQTLKIRAVRDSSVELVGPQFLPRQCSLKLSFLAVDGTATAELTGTVRKVQMVDPEPRYALWVQLEAAPKDWLRDLSLELGGC